MFKKLKDAPRLLLEQELRPIQGSRFQPTGFADLGAADFRLHDKTRMLLVESAQSIANRLEKTCLDGDGPRISKDLEGLPYIVAKLEGATEAETSSLIEAHRINSPFIISNKKFQADFVKKSGYSRGKPIAWDKIASTLLYFDPNALIHGVFMANLEDGRVKIPRALTGFIEASNVLEAVSGGVKNNALDPTGKLRAADYDKDVYGNVPYPRIEYTAEKIRAYFNLDLALIFGFRLPEPALELLIGLSLLKVRRFLASGLRLRTACDFEPKGEIEVRPASSFVLPQEQELLAGVQASIRACTDAGLFASPPVTVIETIVVLKAEKKEDVQTANT
jgi:CRISPR-associated protein Csb1